MDMYLYSICLNECSGSYSKTLWSVAFPYQHTHAREAKGLSVLSPQARLILFHFFLTSKHHVSKKLPVAQTYCKHN